MDGLFTHNLTRIKLSSICCITVTVIHLQLILLGARRHQVRAGLLICFTEGTYSARLPHLMFLFHHWIFDLLARCRDPSVTSINQTETGDRGGGSCSDIQLHPFHSLHRQFLDGTKPPPTGNSV